MEALDYIEKCHNGQNALTGLRSGFVHFDHMTGGLQEGEMIIIASRPSMGKTTFALDIARHVAVEENVPVAVFSQEPGRLLMLRLLCAGARVGMRKARLGMLSRSEHQKLSDAAAALREAPIYIDEIPGLSITELCARARLLKVRHGIQLIVVDDLHYLRAPAKHGPQNRQDEIAEISSGIKAMARQLKIPVIVLAPLNRQPEARGGGRPHMFDLRGSGALEQDADLVGLLLRPEVYEEDEEAKAELAGKAVLIIAKNRGGPVGEVPLSFRKEIPCFEDCGPGAQQSGKREKLELGET